MSSEIKGDRPPHTGELSDANIEKIIASGDLQTAEQLLKNRLARARAKGARGSWSSLKLIEVLKKQGKAEEAEELEGQTPELQSPTSSASFRQTAKKSALEGRPEQAINQLTQALALDPKNKFTLSKLANLLAKAGRLQEAKNHLTTVLLKEPNNRFILTGLALLEMREGEIPEAKAHFETALKSAPKDPIILSNLGRIALTEKNYPAAQDYFKREGVEHPKDPITLYELALATAGAGDEPTAEIYLDKSITLKPNDPRTLEFIVSIKTRCGKIVEAEHYLKTLLALEPDNKDACYYEGKLLYMRGDSKKAEEKIIELIQKYDLTSDVRLKTQILGLFYLISPNHKFWKFIRSSLDEKQLAAITTSSIERLDHLEATTLVNRLYSRTYSSKPVNSAAYGQMGDRGAFADELKKHQELNKPD